MATVKQIIYNPGVQNIDGKARPVFVKVEFDEKQEVHFTGVVGPRNNGDAYGPSGQIDTLWRLDSILAPWTEAMVDRLLALWRTWHLNHLRAGCVHQKEWDTKKELTVTHYSIFDYTYKMEKAIAAETDPEAAATLAREMTKMKNIHRKAVGDNVFRPRGPHLWTTEECDILLGGGFVKEDTVEKKGAGWVYPEEHPEGLLCRACSVCGHEYGSEWLKEEVPAPVLNEIFGFPPSRIVPAWC